MVVSKISHNERPNTTLKSAGPSHSEGTFFLSMILISPTPCRVSGPESLGLHSEINFFIYALHSASFVFKMYPGVCFYVGMVRRTDQKITAIKKTVGYLQFPGGGARHAKQSCRKHQGQAGGRTSVGKYGQKPRCAFPGKECMQQGKQLSLFRNREFE